MERGAMFELFMFERSRRVTLSAVRPSEPTPERSCFFFRLVGACGAWSWSWLGPAPPSSPSLQTSQSPCASSPWPCSLLDEASAWPCSEECDSASAWPESGMEEAP